ncbi:MAG TPA: glycosyltransferase family 4 protein [bacterium]|nr:glycosyltransferase family 4 protein [bacterium]HOL49539.1 glycosyltransferase family 4 protein [bacterium]HPO52515.1 glycosyltransferase family 4 protein [bacterium]
MKIAHVITRMIIGGAQENTLATVSGLKQRGHEVILISGPSRGPEGSMQKDIEKTDVYLIIIPELVRDISIWHDVIAFFKLGQIFRKHRFDIIHTHSAKAGFIGRIAAKFFSKKSKVVHTLHGSSFHPYQNALVRYFYILCEKIASKFTDYFISVSSVILDNHIKRGIVRKQGHSVIRSGFQVEEYKQAYQFREEVRKQLGLINKNILIGMIGRLFPLKGQEYLLRVFAKISDDYPDTHLMLVGDGILRKDFENFVKANHLQQRVHFTGLVEPEKIPLFASSIDIGVHTSLREGLPRAVVQILAAGSPVVAFNIDGAKEVIQNGINGFLVPARNEAMLEEKLRLLIEHPEERKRMGIAGQHMVFEEFSTEKMVAKIEKVYFNIIEKNSSHYRKEPDEG